MAELEKVDLESKNLVAERIEELREFMPEAFSESGIDFEKLRLLLGDEVDEGAERYAFTWPGKADAIRQAQTPSTATLRPAPGKSVDWDTTENLYIEGDNLEVLKLLQRAYHGKVKMIYIDPPYNTGHDFVYKDKFGDTIANYKEQAGLSGQSNAETSGRYHSEWCSMMYPRLKLARELLRDDGIIVISIDDNEMRNLQQLCDELFGEGNRLGTLLWRRRQNPDSRNQTRLSPDSEYLLVYGKSKASVLAGVHIDEGKYQNPDNDPRGLWASVDLSGLANASQRPNLHYDIVDPQTGRVYPPNPKRGWSKSRETIARMIAENRILWPSKQTGRPREKKFLSDLGSTTTSFSSWLNSDIVGFTTHGTREVSELFGGKIFDFPKPVELLQVIIEQCSANGDLCLDFFSGSATFGHAIFSLAAKNCGMRKFILVQLPEASNSEACDLGLRTLCDIGEERIRRAGKKIVAEIEESNRQLKLGEEPKTVPDIGFKVFTLDESGIEKPKPGELVLDVVKSDRSDLDIVYEMMLKWGLDLTLPVEQVDAVGYPCWTVACGELVCCLADDLTMEALEAVAAMDPRRVLIRDSILTDTLKLNAVQTFRRVAERTGREVELRTV